MELTPKQEQFCEIKEFPDYLIYRDGRVYSKSRIDGNNHPKGGIFRKPQVSKKNGYCSIMLNGVKGYKRIYIHRLVAAHFLNNQENLPQVNHKDGNKLNNNVDNLEWGSDSENKIHAIKNGLARTKTEKKSNATIRFNRTKRKLNNQKIQEIKLLRNKGLSFQKIAETVDMSSATICNFFNNKISYKICNET